MSKVSILNTLSKTILPEKLPLDIQKVVVILKKSECKKDCLKKAYEILSSKYKGYRFRTLLFFHIFFIGRLDKLWERSGFIYCNQMNYLLRLLLVKSGHFIDKDIKFKWTLIWYISPHQYCQIKLAKNKYINIDIWGRAQGFPFGDYAHGFYSPKKIKGTK